MYFKSDSAHANVDDICRQWFHYGSRNIFADEVGEDTREEVDHFLPAHDRDGDLDGWLQGEDGSERNFSMAGAGLSPAWRFLRSLMNTSRAASSEGAWT